MENYDKAIGALIDGMTVFRAKGASSVIKQFQDRIKHIEVL